MCTPNRAISTIRRRTYGRKGDDRMSGTERWRDNEFICRKRFEDACVKEAKSLLLLLRGKPIVHVAHMHIISSHDESGNICTSPRPSTSIAALKVSTSVQNLLLAAS